MQGCIQCKSQKSERKQNPVSAFFVWNSVSQLPSSHYAKRKSNNEHMYPTRSAAFAICYYNFARHNRFKDLCPHEMIVIPADPPCANLQFATMAGRELPHGDFHASRHFRRRGTIAPSQAFAFASSAALRAMLPSPLADIRLGEDAALRRIAG